MRTAVDANNRSTDVGTLTGSQSLVLVWILTLAVSVLPDVIWQTATATPPIWLYPAKLVLLASVVIAGFFWKPARPLRLYCLLLLALLITEPSRSSIESMPWWRASFANSGFGRQMLGIQILRVGGAAAMIGVLLVLRFRPREFFLVKGEPGAMAQPVRWLGIDRPIAWSRLGPISGLCISLGTLTFLVLAGRPEMAAMGRAAKLLPIILLLAAMNAFGEELTYRGALLAPAIRSFGPRQAVLLTAIYFGIGHYNGMPNGVIGVAMASILGWFLGKCMTETRGFVWPWLIHFLQDVMIFYFMAIGAVGAGGR